VHLSTIKELTSGLKIRPVEQLACVGGSTSIPQIKKLEIIIVARAASACGLSRGINGSITPGRVPPVLYCTHGGSITCALLEKKSEQIGITMNDN
jgi:hypothetical protein